MSESMRTPEQVEEQFGWIPGFKERFRKNLQRDKVELARELTLMQMALEMLDPQTRWVIEHVFAEVYYVDQRGFPHPGILLGACFELKQIRMLVREETRDYTEHKIRTEWREEIIPKIRLRGLYELKSVEEKPMERESYSYSYSSAWTTTSETSSEQQNTTQG